MRRGLAIPGPDRIFMVRRALRAGWSVEKVQALTQYRPVVPRADGRGSSRSRTGCGRTRRSTAVPDDVVRDAKRRGFSDHQLGTRLGSPREGGARRPPPARHPARLQGGRHVRGRVRGGDAVLLLHLRGGGRAPAGEEAPDRDPRRRPQPDRAGRRVRLLLRPGGLRPARGRLRDGDGEQQPGDGVDRLRHLRRAVLRAADRRARARPLRAPRTRRASSSSSAGRRRSTSRRRSRPRRCRSSARARTASTPRATAGASRPSSSASACASPRTAWRPTSTRRPRWPRPSATPCSCGPSHVLGGRAMEICYDEEMLAALHRDRRRGVAGQAHPRRQVPRGRDRGRRGRGGRRDALRHRRPHGAHRGGRHPLRRLVLHAAGVEPPRARPGRAAREHAAARGGARRPRAS